MGKVQLLSPALASQIAAGEVVERPSSVVKELLENALDAEATRCDVCCDGGGVTGLSVSDDGHGMTEEDARLAVERHATSKLRRIEDLNDLGTFGFRGEALPSIASVSRFTLSTRARDADLGVRVEIEGGKIERVVAEGMKIGTTIGIRDLFFNVPARRKFLRSTGTESAHVTSAVEGAALARPNVTFTLTRDGRRVRELLRVGSRRERVHALLSEETLAVVSGERGPLRLEAHLSAPERARPGAVGLSLIVNGRIVKDRMLAATIAQAYGPILPSGNYPRGVVYFDLPPSLVDVNVHPQKTEVRFVEPRALADAVYAVLSQGLTAAFALAPSSRGSRRSEPRPGIGMLPIERPPLIAQREEPLPRPKSPNRSAPPLTVAERIAPLPSLPNAPRTLPSQRDEALAPEPAEPTPTHETVPEPAEPTPAHETVPEPPHGFASSRFRFLAQVKQSFLVVEGDGGLYVLDQHALAERVTFVRLLEQYQTGAIAAQSMLFPIALDLTQKQTDWLDARRDLCKSLGFDVRLRGPERITVHSLPKLITVADPEQFVRELFAELLAVGHDDAKVLVDRALSQMACRGSLGYRQSIGLSQVQSLLAKTGDWGDPLPLRHKRVVLSVTPWPELDRAARRSSESL